MGSRAGKRKEAAVSVGRATGTAQEGSWESGDGRGRGTGGPARRGRRMAIGRRGGGRGSGGGRPMEIGRRGERNKVTVERRGNEVLSEAEEVRFCRRIVELRRCGSSSRSAKRTQMERRDAGD
ncbi:hypothetical protein MARPO_0113s0059 [Marchantia polymorpha]|uniref:Uncharacterized protein n=1 Tax=Marchantia polymorpha TaxID=3197 RepID=A0A2R6WBV3_MARPO|nr:hypothetical protein MARPO_0113s0059 [Marchantia polymorpha]|eukprot:PTQ31335.1 hypothetical protein MARPO_0113s0059 [Marchantia polymorpha]